MNGWENKNKISFKGLTKIQNDLMVNLLLTTKGITWECENDENFKKYINDNEIINYETYKKLEALK